MATTPCTDCIDALRTGWHDQLVTGHPACLEAIALRHAFTCMDCGDPARSDYMVTAVVWKAHVPPEDRHRLLHLRCLQKRMGRAVVLEELSPVPINETLRDLLGAQR